MIRSSGHPTSQRYKTFYYLQILKKNAGRASIILRINSQIEGDYLEVNGKPLVICLLQEIGGRIVSQENSSKNLGIGNRFKDQTYQDS